MTNKLIFIILVVAMIVAAGVILAWQFWPSTPSPTPSPAATSTPLTPTPSDQVGWSCGDSITYNGQDYSTVQIGDQCWLAENLNIAPNSADNPDCFGGTKYCYDNKSSNCDIYGGLYTWSDMMCGELSSNSKPSGVHGICPDGWHLPSDSEWHTLEDYLTGSGNTCNGTRYASYDCNPAGSKMAGNASFWINDSLNQHADFGTSGLGILPAGRHSDSGSFSGESTRAYLWSSTEESGTLAWMRGLLLRSSKVYRAPSAKGYGFSVRCVRD